MYAKAICTRCNCTGVIDMENYPQSEVIDKLSKIDFGECPLGGYHVEMGKLTDYLLIDFGTQSENQEEVKNAPFTNPIQTMISNQH